MQIYTSIYNIVFLSLIIIIAKILSLYPRAAAIILMQQATL